MAIGGRILSALEEYHHFMMELDTWFRSIRVKYGSRMLCGKGCTLCCRGLFDVPLPDAFRAAAGYEQLSPSVREDVAVYASSLHAGILGEAPDLGEPFFLDRIPEDRIDRLADIFDDVRCPFLTTDGDCLIYEFRPSACILEGVPMVDVHDGPFDDWCELNFTEGLDRVAEADLRLDYYGIEASIQRISENLAEGLSSLPGKETTVFLPSIVVAFDIFWRGLIKKPLQVER
jgi:Fe-S-cluster containining protein